MDQDTFDMLQNTAVELAYRHFDDPTDDHVQAVFERIELNYWWGLGHAGATTVH